MDGVRAKQLIYTRVEEAYSPTRKSGYQVFYVTPSVQASDVDAIVKTVGSFQPHEPGVKRWQCFFLENNNGVVISRTQIIDSHPEIIDRDRRPNVLIAHCLILSLENYDALKNNPFWAIEKFEFVSSATDMIQRYSQSESKETATIFPIPRAEDYYDGDTTWINQALKLALVASPQFIHERKTLLLYGNHKDVYETLKTIFAYTPPSYRKNLTFDTYVRGRRIEPGKFWAVGSNERSSGYTNTIDASSRVFTNDPEPFSDLYILWLQSHIDRNIDLEILPAVHEIVDAIYYKRPPNPSYLNSQALQSFMDIHQNFIWLKVLNAIKGLLGESVASKFFPNYSQTCSLEDAITIAATEAVSPKNLAPYLREWLVSLSFDLGKISQKDWDTFRKFSIVAQDVVITLWSAVFTKDKKLFLKTAETMTPSDYVYALMLMMNPISPIAIFIPKYLPQFVYELSNRLDQLQENEYVDIIQLIIENNAIQEIERLARFIPKLGNKELTRLEKIISSQNLPPRFRFAMGKRRSELGQPYTFVDVVLGRR